ncbi:MAG TPA: ATP-binding cassette domain-containing protein, partial [bacterium]|nr:ATP-binding cassette domain-containing protein [bacterium]
MNIPLIDIKTINKTYVMGDTEVRALQGVSLTIERGEFVAIIGPSGSGKSTLLHTLGFLDRPDSGQYYFDGYDVSKLNDDDLASLRNTNAGFVFQQFYLLSRMTALENAELPLIYGGSSQVKETASQKLKDVGLADRANHKPNELS